MKLRMPIGVKVATYVGSIVVLILLAIFIVVVKEVDMYLTASVNSNSIQIANARSDEIEMFIQQHRQMVKALADQDYIRACSETELEYYAQEMIGKMGPAVSHAYVVWPDGRATTQPQQYVMVPDRPYYIAIFREGRDNYMSNPQISRNSGNAVITMVQSVDDPAGNAKAALAFEITLEQLSKTVSGIDIGKTSYGWVVDSTGLVMASKIEDAIMKVNITEGDEMHGYRGMTVLSRTILSSENTIGEYKGFDGTDYTLFSSEISPEYKWRLGLVIATEELRAPQNRLNLILGIIMGVSILISIGLSVLLGMWISRPIKNLAAEFAHLAQGEADLTHRLEIKRTDEIGELGANFNNFIGKLSAIIMDIKLVQDRIKISSQKLGADSQQTTVEMKQISDLVDSIQNRLGQQDSNIHDSSAAVNQSSQGVYKLDELIADQAASISEASASIEEMVSSISSVTASAEHIADEFQHLLVSSDKGLAIQNASKEKINNIASQSEGLMEANAAIGAIAAQTNLLAMNAAIEAAHAGEAGKGFAVVADEIRRLAETSSEQSKTIGAKLKSVQESIDEVVRATDESEKAFESLSRKVGATDSLVSEVKSAMIEQREGSRNILDAIKHMNEITSKVKASSSEMNEGNRIIVESMEKLTLASKEIFSNSREIVSEVDSVEAMVKEISDIAVENDSLVNRMEDGIGRFTV
ncbi:methyl-accepting chemotaxis protein [Breznakiella homolactica]|uniref:Methyl-accepting chemotaxis protein n=1 Tax=Breznakiella homolactica TaxID=2798577 RepID=A0A7T8B8I8_9SPIR|nr:methyl-accepting chemotaxis protein [Breznakiella homolactica]QQO07427.1 methyl-accepting chemotaxis protein [Breznakiella homolactica]